MNAVRVAALLRELADELEDGDAPLPIDAPPPPKSKPRRRRCNPLPPPPLGEPSEIARAHARKLIRSRRIGT